MIISVTGGKGGTGKSTIATSLAYYLSQNNKVLLIDADVECPNDNLILPAELKERRNVEQFIPKFDMDKCNYCGECSRNCKEHAIIIARDKLLFFPEQCTGCKVCMIVCPKKAISNDSKTIGEIITYYVNKNLTIKTGVLKPGVEESSPIVSELIKEADNNNYDFTIIDTAAGTHCNVIKAILPSDEAILVTEPTPLGLNDLKLIVGVIKEIKKKAKVVINKFGLSREYEEKIEEFCREEGIEIIGRVNYDERIRNSYINKKPIINQSINKIGDNYERRTY